jgi:hypothetical protein
VCINASTVRVTGHLLTPCAAFETSVSETGRRKNTRLNQQKVNHKYALWRGLKVGLVEQSDFGAGTSSRSTKLVHGGVRYLEKAFFQLDYSQLKLVFEALYERRRMLDNAPHLTQTLPIMTVRRRLVTYRACVCAHVLYASPSLTGSPHSYI